MWEVWTDELVFALRATGEWRSLLAALDKNVEQSLRQTVKKSLQELSRAINGDQKVDAQSLFKVRDWRASASCESGRQRLREVRRS